MIKVLIVEDSRVVSEYLYYILSSDPKIQVVGNVSNGMQAIEFLRENKPDVITMDIDMPVMDGLEATRRIMSTIPVPIIVVTASRNAREVQTTMEALAAGALSVIEKPAGIGHPKEKEQRDKLITMVKIMAEVKVITRRPHPIRKPVSIPAITPATGRPAGRKPEPSIADFSKKKVVAIGISSGGPSVLQTIFSKISEKFPLPIVVVQHITEGFLEGLVNWLSRKTMIPIHVAAEDETILPGHIYFAPDKHQMGLDNPRKIKLSKCEKKKNLCPSVAHLFSSIVKKYGKYSIAIILTGMGKDGAKELKMLRDAGAITIAQDKESSLVHGMPGVAIKLHAASMILNPEEIANILHEIERNNIT